MKIFDNGWTYIFLYVAIAIVTHLVWLTPAATWGMVFTILFVFLAADIYFSRYENKTYMEKFGQWVPAHATVVVILLLLDFNDRYCFFRELLGLTN